MTNLFLQHYNLRTSVSEALGTMTWFNLVLLLQMRTLRLIHLGEEASAPELAGSGALQGCDYVWGPGVLAQLPSGGSLAHFQRHSPLWALASMWHPLVYVWSHLDFKQAEMRSQCQVTGPG